MNYIEILICVCLAVLLLMTVCILVKYGKSLTAVKQQLDEQKKKMEELIEIGKHSDAVKLGVNPEEILSHCGFDYIEPTSDKNTFECAYGGIGFKCIFEMYYTILHVEFDLEESITDKNNIRGALELINEYNQSLVANLGWCFYLEPEYEFVKYKKVRKKERSIKTRKTFYLISGAEWVCYPQVNRDFHKCIEACCQFLKSFRSEIKVGWI